ncbi:PhoH family protein [Paucibacter sp. TC2R-5]|uniref:PhoH family protein n=1 Tax=Paucibacter sp. TC2R-5 TaxID=2893555 RepID=UPI0021E3F4E7|nr:PhoH family protein [Paucibacter sp. TC2R-5]MCV2357787.1 PhoH family protein [Paucibacter sp. TC2R-5]
MPLPKPPTKRASRLESSAFEANLAVSKPDAPRKSAPPVAAAKAAPAVSQAAPVAVASTKPAASNKAATPVTTTQDVQTTFAPPRATGAKTRPAATTATKLASAESAAQPKTSKSKKAAAAGAPKLFVLDTNVLMHDPMCLFRFEEHDIYLPMITLEEMDGHKKGMTEVARNVRQVSRELDNLAGGLKSSGLEEMAKGLPLNHTGHREAGGKLFFQTQLVDAPLPPGLPQGKADNQILAVVTALKLKEPGREVVLVSKDINMRIKARALGLPTEDYRNDKTLEDSDLLYTGVQALPADFWERHGKTMESWSQGGITFYRISGPLVPSLLVNELIYLEAPGAAPLYAKVLEITGKTAVLRTLKDYGNQKHKVWGVTARNREQNFALNLLMDPDVDFVTLTGTAGTGKTLMTLAAGLSQVLDERRYSEIIVTRVTVPVGEDIGFLPGTEEEKMSPWMGALDDNMEVLGRGDNTAGEWGRAATNDLVRSKIKIKSMNFMRGRTFLNKYVIIDEAQNLTPKQMKTLITRAGPGTKIVCLGNLAQIDTPYLTEGSSGLTFAVDRFKGWAHSGHVTLARGERSRLADFASEVL